MSSVAAPPAGTDPAPRPADEGRRPWQDRRVVAVAGLLVLVAISLYLRTRALNAAFWIDEAIAVGVSSYDFFEIPEVLRLDGSPPLYYLLLHLWMQAFGTGESATHVLSLLFSLAAIPVAWWAVRSLYGAKAGWIAAVLAALSPYLTYYAQETRMYSMQAVFGMIAATCFVHGFVLRRRRYVWGFGLALAAMVYTHNWGLFFGMGTAVALGVLWRLADGGERRALLLDGVRAYGLVGVLFLPWVPTLLHQAAHTGAPWATRPSLGTLVDAIGWVLGGLTVLVALTLVAGNGLLTLIRDRADRRATALVTLTLASVAIAWLVSQVSPAFANRYFASFVGPLLLLAAIGLSRAGRMGLVCLAIVCVLWFDDRSGALHGKSNVRSLSASIATLVTTGDLVVSTHPEQLPVIAYYMPKGVRYADTLGPVEDPRVFDWTDAIDRLRATKPKPTVDALVSSLRPGQELVLVQPIIRTGRWRAPWTSLVRKRAIQWERRLEADPRVRREAVFPVFGYDRLPRGARAIVYRVKDPAR